MDAHSGEMVFDLVAPNPLCVIDAVALGHPCKIHPVQFPAHIGKAIGSWIV